MKNIVLKIMTALALLSLIILSSCRAEPFELNNPDRPWTPFQGMVVEGIPPFEIVEERLIILRAESRYSDDFVWRRDGQVLEGRNYDTLHIEASGFFPDVPLITVAGRNVSGVGAFSDTVLFSFLPWEKPGIPYPITGDRRDTTLIPGGVIIGDAYINVCPTPFVVLTANIWQATIFEWYFNDEPIDNPAGINSRTLNVGEGFFVRGGDTIRGTGTADGVYTVRGRNMHGVSVMSDPVTVEWTECATSVLVGTWNIAGYNIWGDISANHRSWTDVITQDETDGTTFWIHHWFGTEADEWRFRVHNDPTTGNYFFLNNDFNGVVDNNGENVIRGIAVRNPIVVGQSQPVYGFGTDGFRIYLEFTEDGNLFRIRPFTTPGEFASHGIGMGVRGVGGGAFLGFYATGTALLDIVFTRGGTAPTAKELESAVWIAPQGQTQIPNANAVRISQEEMLEMPTGR